MPRHRRVRDTEVDGASPETTTEVMAVADLDAPSTIAPPMAPAARLVAVMGPQVGTVFRLGSRPVVIGRDDQADIGMSGSDVSWHHAQIAWHGSHYVLTDLGSRNGTAVNGVPIVEHSLAVGDRIRIGATAILLLSHHDELEERALQLHKLEALAQLAGGLVHDFRNTLGIISVNVDLLGEMLRDGRGHEEGAQAMLADVRAATAAGAALTERLLAFSRRSEVTAWKTVAVGTLVDNVVGLIRRLLETRHKIQIQVDVDRELAIRGDADELQQALLNVCFNARDAMPGGGLLSVRARARRLSHAEALRAHLPFAGAYVEISVTDDGIGMDESTVARIFEPFFTTKRAGQGTGLGLSSVYGVARNHGGAVLAESTPGVGTRILVMLPVWVADPSP
jgi:signal transduction histidine kinase